MFIWRIWQLRNDLIHGKEFPPIPATVEFLDSYYKSIKLAAWYTMEEIIKGKMSTGEKPLPDQGCRVISTPWPAP